MLYLWGGVMDLDIIGVALNDTILNIILYLHAILPCCYVVLSYKGVCLYSLRSGSNFP